MNLCELFARTWLSFDVTFETRTLQTRLVCTTTTTMDNSNTFTKNKDSRKRTRNSLDDKQSYYDRLLFQCRKDLHKQAKRVKQFETQKLIRRKQANNSTKIDEIKAYDSFEPVIQECLRRLGILALNPNDDDGNDPSPPAAPAPSSWVTERILQHKQMRDAIDKWHEEVTNYRRWCLQQQEREERRQQNQQNSHTTKSQPHAKKVDDQHQSATSSVFLQLGENGEEEEPRRKNRKGQRARRARALAIEAKKNGRVLRPEDSLNWRPKRKKDDEGPKDLNNTTPAKNDEALHPSWQARKEQKKGIVEFQGKKTTF